MTEVAIVHIKKLVLHLTFEIIIKDTIAITQTGQSSNNTTGAIIADTILKEMTGFHIGLDDVTI